VVAGILLFSQNTYAAFDPLTGWAWSDSIGWISFSSKNCDTNGDGQSEGTPSGCPANETSIASYGVDVDGVSGTMRGYAWSEGIGWISFNSTDTEECPSSPCSAIFNKTTGVVDGWARALSANEDWDGFIHLRGSNYGVSVTTCDWDGYAWGSENVGWIKFKGANYGVKATGNSCQTSNDLLVSVNPKPIEIPVQGNSLTFSGTVKNAGSGTIGTSFSNQFKIDVNNDGSSANDVTISPTTTISSLGAGAVQETTSAIWNNIPLGNHRVILCADAPVSTIDEFDETNNCSDTTGSGGVFAVLTKPDLLVSEGPAPVGNGLFVAGTSLSFDGTVRNQGGSTANGSFRNQFIIDIDNNGGNDVIITPDPTLSDLSSGATSQVTSGPWANILPGTHEITLCSDTPSPVIFESNESNNCSSATFTVLTKPNLLVPNDPIVASGILVAGQDLTFSADVRNIGEGTAGVFTSHFEVDQNNDGTIDLSFSPDPSISSLAQDTSATITTLSSWNNIPSGTHAVHLCADTGNSISESDETDNCNITLITISTKPDLVVSSGPSISGILIQGSTLTFSGDIKNQGGSVAGGTFSSRFEIDDFDNGGTPIVLASGQTTALAPENTSTLTSGQWSNIPAGIHTVTLCVDGPLSSINESNETNNCSSISFTVATKADLSVTTPNINGTLIEGYTLTFSSTVTNQGETDAATFPSRFCIDNASCATTTGGIVGGESSTSSLDGGASTGTITSAAWIATAGNHDVYFCADSNDSIDELSESNNCRPASFTVVSQTMTLSSFTATPDTGVRPLEVSFAATISGTALGNVNYSLWWNCTNPTTSVALAFDACGALPVGVPAGTCVANTQGVKCEAMPEENLSASTQSALKHIYANPGSYTAKIITERGSAPSKESRISVTADLPPVDATISNAPAPASDSLLVKGHSITLTANVQNIGAANIEQSFSHEFKIDVNNDASLTPDVVLPLVFTPSLAGDSEITITSPSWNDIPSGTHRVMVCTDKENALDEANEANNCSSSTGTSGIFTVTEQTMSVSITPDPISGIRPLEVTLGAQISGTALGTANFGFWWDCNDTASNMADAKEDCGALPTPSSGTCSDNTIGAKCNGITTTTINGNDHPQLKHIYSFAGTYHPKVVIEQGSATPREQRGTVNVSLPPHDLTASVNPSPTSPSLTAGYNATFIGSIRNAGSANLTNAFNAEFRVDVGNDGNNSNDVVLDPIEISSLGASASQSVSTTWSDIQVGTHRVILCADRPNPPDIDESNETNNCSSTTGSTGVFTVAAQTLSVNLTSDTENSVAPADVQLEATVSGNALGNINYSFWWHCNTTSTSISDTEAECGALPAPVSGSCITNNAGAKCANINTPSRSVSRIYNDGGTYNPKVIVERGSATPSQDRDPITIPSQTLFISAFSATPDIGVRPLESSLSVTTSGTALGTTNFSFWWNCTNSSTSVSAVATTCGALPTDPAPGQCAANSIGAKCFGINGDSVNGSIFSSLRHTYPTPNTYSPKAIVERGSAPSAEKRNVTVTVTLPPHDLTVSVNPSAPSGVLTEGRGVLLSGTVKNIGTAAISQPFNSQLRIDINNDGNQANDVVFPPTSLSSLGAGNTQEISATWNPAVVGTHRVVLCADTPNPPDIDEANETNNCSVTTGSIGVFTVEKQTIIATFSATAPSTPAPVDATLKTQITGGTAQGSINYYYWWDCASFSNNVTTVEKLCGDLPLAPQSGECFVNEDGARCSQLTVATHSLTHTYADGGVYEPKVIIERESAVPVEKRDSLSLGDQTLGISFSANPNSGIAPINSTLSASVTSGTASGPVNYSFWWNCASTTTSISSAETTCGTLSAPASGTCAQNTKGAKCNGMPDTTVGVEHEYESGTFQPKVIVERGSSKSTQRQTSVSTSAQELGVTLTSTPQKGVVPTNITLSASVSGSARGTINYSFWWDCDNTSSSPAVSETACGALTNPNAGNCVASVKGYKCSGVNATTQTAVHQYAEEGDFTPKVIAERGNAPSAVAQNSVEIDPQLFTLAFTASPNSGLEPLSTILSAQVTGNASGTINYSFWWDCSSTSTSVSETKAKCGDIPSPPAGICLENTFGKKCDGIVSRTLDSVHAYTEDNNYSPKTIVEWGAAPTKESRAQVVVSPQTLTTTLDASPTSGQSQFNTTLTAETRGTAVGTINYSFWWDCEQNGTDIVSLTASCGSLPAPLTGTCAENIQGVKCLSMSSTVQRVVHTYFQPKTYHPKVVTERGGAPSSEATTSISVSQPPARSLSVTLITDTANGIGLVNSKLKATTNGDAQGFNTYYLWWDCERDTTNPKEAMTQCGALPEMPDNAVCTGPNQFGVICNEMVDLERMFSHTYQGPQAGEAGPKVYYPKVIVSRGGSVPNATAITSIMISRPPLVPTAVFECNDGADNNSNGLVDYPADPGCGSLDDPKEDTLLIVRVAQCDDGLDNDGDGKIDYPDDQGCSSPIDDAENDAVPPPPTITIPATQDAPAITMPLTECNDGIDNNSNGKIDYPADPGCGSLWDTREDTLAIVPLNQCNDGRDNDGDGKIDYPADPDCRSPHDADERGRRRPTFQEVSPGGQPQP